MKKLDLNMMRDMVLAAEARARGEKKGNKEQVVFRIYREDFDMIKRIQAANGYTSSAKTIKMILRHLALAHAAEQLQQIETTQEVKKKMKVVTEKAAKNKVAVDAENAIKDLYIE